MGLSADQLVLRAEDGRTRAVRHRKIVESFLDCAEHLMLARLAVQTPENR